MPIQRVVCELGFLLRVYDMTSAEDTALVAFLPPQTSSDTPVWHSSLSSINNDVFDALGQIFLS